VTADRVELLVERRGEAIALLSPGVGLFTAARPAGDLLSAGAEAGVLLVLGRALRLVVPDQVEGRVSNPAPALTHHPVSWGELLYQVEPIDADARLEVGRPEQVRRPDVDAPARVRDASSRLLFRSPQSGRFYLRPSPADDAFVAPGAVVEPGQPVGLIEVMKTFAHLPYAAAGGLPTRARVLRVLVEDGAEVGAGDPLLELEAV
jgi:acetyl-CoA carboxylase biotin carboxyl carrier protein